VQIYRVYPIVVFSVFLPCFVKKADTVFISPKCSWRKNKNKGRILFGYITPVSKRKNLVENNINKA